MHETMAAPGARGAAVELRLHSVLGLPAAGAMVTVEVREAMLRPHPSVPRDDSPEAVGGADAWRTRMFK